MSTHPLRLAPKPLVYCGLVLFVAALVRVLLLQSPHTGLEGDEAIVGLMARHILLLGDRPVFYYMQPYLGSLEAYLVAGSFALFGSSTLALKLVPLLLGLVFVGLVFATGYRIGGLWPAVVAGLYVAVPPAFLAIWSLKARGGYIETLVIGQLLILLAMDVADRQTVGTLRALAIGFLVGFGMWVNPLVVVYLVPIAVYLAAVLRRRLLGRWLLVALVAAIVGAYPLVDYNLRQGLATMNAMFGQYTGESTDTGTAIYRFFRYCLPILAGAAQACSNEQLFWPVYESGMANTVMAPRLVLGTLLLAAALGAGKVPDLVRGRKGGADGRNLLLLILLVVPTVFVMSKFREQFTEPRYLLPMYSLVPLLGFALAGNWPWRRLAPLVVAALLALNVYSISSMDLTLNMPETASGSTAANRAELSRYLLSHGLDRVYSDYWIAYPLVFETQEKIVASVYSGGFNRYIPYAYLVEQSESPAFVFVADSREEEEFMDKLTDRGITGTREAVSIYAVYRQLSPLEAARR